MTTWTIERYDDTTDEWKPVRDSGKRPLTFADRRAAHSALRMLPHMTKGHLTHYRLVTVKE